MLAFEKKVAAKDENSSGYANDADTDLESEDSDSDTEEVESPYNLSGLLTASRAVPEATKAQAEIAELRSHIATLEETNDKLRKSNNCLRKRQRDYFEGNDDDSNKRPSSKIAAAVLDALDGVSYRFRRHKMARVGKRFVEAVWNYNGAAGNKGTSNKSRLVPVARWLQRRLVFLCGYTTEAEIDDYVKENPITNTRTQK
mmetsp:Transcript_16530/g.29841  ORF Transcript_16530/g.29841 Transcript_16530/m.29841 type:complete len:200 (+) Transcript_16530:563-1162(+)